MRWYRKLLLWIEATGRRNRVVHRLQLLQSIKYSLRTNPSNGRHPRKVQRDIGPCLLAFQETVEDVLSSTEKPGAAAWLLRQAAFHRNEDFASAIARTWRLVETLDERVTAQTSARSFRTFYREAFDYEIGDKMSIAFAALVKYQALSPDDLAAKPNEMFITPSYFRNINESQRGKVLRVFDGLACSLSQHAERAAAQPSHYDFRSMYDHPFVRLDNQAVYFPLDLHFLLERATEGIYWDLIEHLRHNGRQSDTHSIGQYWGDALECHTGDLLRDIQSRGRDVWLDWDGQIVKSQEDAKIPDAVVHEGETLLMFEVTRQALRPAEIISGDPELIRAGIERVWFAKGNKAAKMRQLEGAGRGFRDGTWSVSNVTPSEIKNITYVLVTHTSFPIHPLLTDWYTSIITDNGLDPSFARKLYVLNIEELEWLCVLAGRNRITDILEKYRSDNVYGNRAFRDWLVGREKTNNLSRNKFIEQAWADFKDASLNYFEFK